MSEETAQVVSVSVAVACVCTVLLGLIGYATWTNLTWAPSAAEIEKVRVQQEGQAKISCINAGGLYENQICKWAKSNPANGGDK
jgi:hypothetical protein